VKEPAGPENPFPTPAKLSTAAGARIVGALCCTTGSTAPLLMGLMWRGIGLTGSTRRPACRGAGGIRYRGGETSFCTAASTEGSAGQPTATGRLGRRLLSAQKPPARLERRWWASGNKYSPSPARDAKKKDVTMMVNRSGRLTSLGGGGISHLRDPAATRWGKFLSGRPTLYKAVRMAAILRFTAEGQVISPCPFTCCECKIQIGAAFARFDEACGCASPSHQA